MAIILSPSPPLETLLLSLLPPSFLPPTEEESPSSSVLPIELANWHALLARTLQHIGMVLDEESLDMEEKRKLSEGLSRWSVQEGGEGWLFEGGGEGRELREEVDALLLRLPPPSLLSLRPVFASSPPPPAISTTSFRPLARPVVNDSVAPDREPWKENVGWGCWNVLRRAMQGCDDKEPVPLPMLLPPLLTLLDDPTPSIRLRGLGVVRTMLNKCSNASNERENSRGWGGPWLVQTGIGELIMKSLSLTLHLSSTSLSPLILASTLQAHLHLTTLLYPVNSKKRTESIDELIEKGVVGTWVYRTGGEEGECARTVSKWLGTKGEDGFVGVLGGLGVTRVLGTLLPSLLLPLTTLTPTSPRSQPFLLSLLSTILLLLQTSLRTSPERVAVWRGKVLSGLGRLWVAIREGEVVEGEDNASLREIKQAMFEVLVVLSKSHSEFLEEELGTLIELDRKMFVGLYEGTKTLLVELDASS
ncbi:hypothetical protein BDY24DRAFT_402453 [Mrakia frigida]|uniref:uncharacterized protein n=1 Tax=Mrakia frigida TaxID=29902 RepID=UPI003FCBF6E7